jgi:ParB family chromosome partitioning protein
MAQQMIVALEQIQPNPYQTRTSEDPEHVEKIARSIAANTLLQIPLARQIEDGGGCQLAFGHTRFKAYRFLNAQTTEWFVENEYPVRDYREMPLNILDLSNEEMYRHAVAENSDRKDLDTIEEAAAMKMAMQEFNYTSKQVGELFGKSESTVRGLVRLLDLPQEAQNKVRTGELSQGTARQLLAIAPLVKPESLDQIAIGLASNPGRPEYQVSWDISSALSKAKAVEMGKETAGDELWPLTWTFGANMPTGKDALAGWKGPKFIETQIPGVGRPTKMPIGEVFSMIATTIRDGKSRDEIVGQRPEWAEAVDYLKQISNPPACTDCSHTAKHDGKTYCGIKACFERKRALWLAQELEALSKQTGIRIYDRDEDGGEQIRVTREYVYWTDSEDTDKAKAHNAANQARYDSADPNLRLGLVDEKYSRDWLTERKLIAVFDVSAEARAKEAEKLAKAAARVEEERNRDANRETEQENSEQARRFLNEVALDCFAVAFAKLDNIGLMMALARVNDGGADDLPRSKKLQLLRRHLAARVLDHVLGWQEKKQGAVFVANGLQGVATSWGVQLPEDWMETAARYAEAVAVETDEDGEEGADDDSDEEYDE